MAPIGTAPISAAVWAGAKIAKWPGSIAFLKRCCTIGSRSSAGDDFEAQRQSKDENAELKKLLAEQVLDAAD